MPTKKATTQSPTTKKTAPQKSEATTKTAATPTDNNKAAATRAPKSSEKAAATSASKSSATSSASKTATGSKAANKKAPSKTPAAKKTVSKKTTSSTTGNKTSSATKKTTGTTTQIIAKVDVGFGNTIFIRGEGAGLSWEKGIPMANAGTDEWSWSTKKASSALVFKFLLNDETWAQGDNITAAPGDTAITTPSF